jgi:uncharacterized protein involved in outer membrane biogenesis
MNLGKTRRKAVAIASLVTLAAYVAAGSFLVPPLVKRITMQKIEEALHRKVQIRELKVNPLSLSLIARGFSMALL